MKNNWHIKILSIIFFLVFLAVGFNLASHKPIWGDEAYTQVSSVERHSYVDILLGRVEEGNVTPLFYLIQKSISKFLGFNYSQKHGNEMIVHDNKTQIVMRINPVVSITLAIVCMFSFFSRHYSLAVGFVSIAVTLSSYMVWLYWAEARHYAMWFFLTVIQSLTLIGLIKYESTNEKYWKRLTIIHFVMSFAIVFSLFQIFWASLIALMFDKNKSFKKYFYLTILPLMIAATYYYVSPRYDFFMNASVGQLIFPNVPLDRWIFIGLFVLFLAFYVVEKKWLPKKIFKNYLGPETYGYLGMMIGIFNSAVIMMSIFILNDTKDPSRGFEVSIRYFIYLTAVTVVGISLFAGGLIELFKTNIWAKRYLWLFLTGSILYGFFKNAYWAIGVY